MGKDQYEYSDVEFEYWWRQVKDDILPTMRRELRAIGIPMIDKDDQNVVE